MIISVRLVALIYAILVRLYPQTFRATFEEKMRIVFKQALVEASGARKVCDRYFLRVIWS